MKAYAKYVTRQPGTNNLTHGRLNLKPAPYEQMRWEAVRSLMQSKILRDEDDLVLLIWTRRNWLARFWNDCLGKLACAILFCALTVTCRVLDMRAPGLLFVGRQTLCAFAARRG